MPLRSCFDLISTVAEADKLQGTGQHGIVTNSVWQTCGEKVPMEPVAHRRVVTRIAGGVGSGAEARLQGEDLCSGAPGFSIAAGCG